MATEETQPDPLQGPGDPWMTKEAMQDGAEKATALPPKRGGVDMHPYNGVEGTPGKGSPAGLQESMSSNGIPPGFKKEDLHSSYNSIPTSFMPPFGMPTHPFPVFSASIPQTGFGTFAGPMAPSLSQSDSEELRWWRSLAWLKGVGKGQAPKTEEPWSEVPTDRVKKEEETQGTSGGGRRNAGGDRRRRQSRDSGENDKRQDETPRQKERKEDPQGPPEGPPEEPNESDDPEESSGFSSSAPTTELRSMLRRQAKVTQDRPRSSLGSVKIEEFYGDRHKYLKWKKAVQAQEVLYRLEPEELSMLIYLSTKKDARDVLDQKPIQEYTRPGGVRLIWHLLDEAFGESEEELFERAEQEFATYRRLPGQSISTFLGQLKRLKAQYMRVDPESTMSDRAWSQRMLNRASLSRRERLDVFFSAGGRYTSQSIETALRHRCGRIHEEERKLPSYGFSRTPGAKPYYKRSQQHSRGATKNKRPEKKTFYEDKDAEEEEEAEEDLEAEEDPYREYINDTGNTQEVLMEIREEDVDEDEEDEESFQDDDLKEAWAAGWRAKSQQNEKKKYRGWKTTNRSSTGGTGNSISPDKKKINSTCSSCGERGHWRGDPQCKNVQTGKDKPHKKKEGSGSGDGGGAVHFTYVVTTTKKVKTEVEEEKTTTQEEPGRCTNPDCRGRLRTQDRFCPACGMRVAGDLSMREKRGWEVIKEDEEADQGSSAGILEVLSSGDEEQPPEFRYEISRSQLKEMLGTTPKPEDGRSKVKLKPEEVLAALPNMSRSEKKELRRQLQEGEEDRAWRTYSRYREVDGIGVDERGRPSGASGSGYQPDEQAPIRPKARSKKEELPKAVKTRQLDKFRRGLYEDQLQGDRLVPSTCAPTPTTAQARCHHPFESIRWSANADGHYGRCKACDLRHVIYFSERHGALVATTAQQPAVTLSKEHEATAQQPAVTLSKEHKATAQQPAVTLSKEHEASAQQPAVTLSTEHEAFITGNSGEAIADSGCRCAVAGQAWHTAMQEELKRKGMTWHEEKESETFRFGSGDPETSNTAYIYPVGIYGKNDLVRMSCVGGGALHCPGLVGPSELSRWGAVARFQDRTLELKGEVRPMKLTYTRHPAIDLMEYQPGTEGAQFWTDASIQSQLRTLKSKPHAWAFVAEEHKHTDDEEASTDTEVEEEEDDEDMGTRKRMMRKWMAKLDEHLHSLPGKTLNLEESEEEESSGVSSDGTVTSHEFGIEPWETDEDTDEEELMEEQVYHQKQMSKHEKRALGHNTTVLRDVLQVEKKGKKKDKKKDAAKPKAPVRKGGPWRVLEVFTWSCMVSMVAVKRGWQMLEPVTLPHWDLLDPAQREQAHRYIDEAAPDLLVIAWPCRLWSPIQALNYKTTEEKEILGALRQEERPLLDFVKEAAQKQRARGGAVMGENPKRSKAWKEPPIQDAFEGLPHVDTDMCAHGLQRPDNGCPVRKPTRLAGTPEIMRRCAKTCNCKQQHAPCMGAVKIDGRWQSIAAYAGGYTRQFATRVVEGAEEYLRGTRRYARWATSEHLPEERFVAVDDWDGADIEEEFRSPRQEQEQGETQETEPREEEETDQEEAVPKREEAPEDDRRRRQEARIRAREQMAEDAGEARREDLEKIRRIHSRMGHPLKEALRRMMKLAGVPKRVVDTLEKFQCPTCDKMQPPSRPRPQRSDLRPTVFNESLHVDLKYAKDVKKQLYVSGAYAPWQNSFAERHGAILGVAWNALVVEHQVTDRKGMKTTLLCAIQAKNQTVTRRGYSAETLVYGRNSNFPDLLDDDAIDNTTLGQALSLDTQVAKQAEMRAAAKRALLHQDAQQKLKQAIQRKPGNQVREYLPGEKVYFWVPGAKRVRYRKDAGVWRGPALVIAREGQQKYFISWRGRCLLVAATNLRPGTVEEAEDVAAKEEEGRQFDEQMQTQKTIEEIQKAEPPDEEGDGEKWKTEGEVLRRSDTGSTKERAKAMMRGLKTVRKALEEPRLRREYRKRRKAVEPAREEQEETPAEAETKEEEEEVWKGIHEAEERYAREDEKRIRRITEQRKTLLDDVPECMKRRRVGEVDEQQVQQRLTQGVFTYVQNVVMEEEIQEMMAKKAQQQIQERRGWRKNEWMKREEVAELARLLDLPISAVRIHRQPRKRLHPPPAGKRRSRVTVMLLEQQGEAMVLTENQEKTEKNKKTKTPMSWRGMTLFLKTGREKEEEKEEKQAYIQIGDEVFATPYEDSALWQAFVRREEEMKVAAEALLLKMKASGKELDPRFFDEAEKAAFRESDKKEWESWVKNSVLQRLTAKEAAQVPKNQIFKAPLRMVRVNKGKDDTDLKPKSRLVIPGHLDPELGGYRTDSPTTMPCAVRLLKTLIVAKSGQRGFSMLLRPSSVEIRQREQYM
ncbi:unnamed protein product [Cladocopium goreaui]|uniref:Retrovirus-related Pol polyprotein from transposon TNT 1-94 n=1 Tax=Cladocopium goreaui TaxID=2562237 RepID=A0A9P1FMR7_9DINO|nr:unnamed protein product [Cladocopium goreaui]